MRVSTPELLFGQVLRQARTDCAISQQELSFRAGIHWSYVSQLERGLKSPSLGVVFRLAEALSVSPITLVAAVEEQWRAEPESPSPV